MPPLPNRPLQRPGDIQSNVLGGNAYPKFPLPIQAQSADPDLGVMAALSRMLSQKQNAVSTTPQSPPVVMPATEIELPTPPGPLAENGFAMIPGGMPTPPPQLQNPDPSQSEAIKMVLAKLLGQRTTIPPGQF